MEKPTAEQVEFQARRFKERQSSRLDPHFGRSDAGAVRAIGAFLRRGYLFLPISAVFALGSAAYVVYESAQRRAKPVCVDCNRQREIAEEIYGTKTSKRDSSKMLP